MSTHDDQLAPCLLAAPTAFVDESPASWVQRVSGAHHYSLRRLTMATKIRPQRFDWDSGVSDNDWGRLLKLSHVPSDSCGEARFGMRMLREQLPKVRHFCHDRDRPSYRWCSACFAEDSTPYLRWEWRLQVVKRCTAHETDLLEQCEWCNSPLTLQRALLVSAGAIPGVPDLATCGTCGMPLTVDCPKEADQSDIETTQIIDQIKQHYLHGGRQLEIDFSGYGCPPRSTELRMGASWFDLSVHRQVSLDQLPFHLNGDSFEADKCRESEVQRRDRWTDGLRPSDRRRLAEALQIVRGEKNRLRLLGLDDPKGNAKGLRL
jgi:hypothetical protein